MLDILHQHSGWIIAGSYLLLECVSIVAAVHAVMNVRTAQGATAWLLALVTVPFIALPLYGVFGRRRFMGYVEARRADDAAIEQATGSLRTPDTALFRAEFAAADVRRDGFETIARTPFLGTNQARLLVDGEATFDAMFAAMAQATSYVLVQFYIVRDDGLGMRLKQQLLDCLTRGVRVYLLYDAIGSYQLKDAFPAELKNAGGFTASFTGTTRRVRQLQINFRNHRKLVIVDGHTCFVGGLNVGDEYLGKDNRPWRDTHVQVRGPAATASQLSFVEDWYWATDELPEVDWQPRSGGGSCAALPLPSAPTDEVEACALMFVHAIHAARTRLWIVSPYFVPNGSIIDALKLAALRGVDVRVLLPDRSDNRLVDLAGRAYLPELLPSGVRVFRYEAGFLHQKVMLIDNDLAIIGTANLDNRSMRLNFELSLVFADRRLAAEVAAMLVTDFDGAVELTSLENDSFLRRAAARGARLLAPVL